MGSNRIKIDDAEMECLTWQAYKLINTVTLTISNPSIRDQKFKGIPGQIAEIGPDHKKKSTDAYSRGNNGGKRKRMVCTPTQGPRGAS
jgi:hypothetical protein